MRQKWLPLKGNVHAGVEFEYSYVCNWSLWTSFQVGWRSEIQWQSFLLHSLGAKTAQLSIVHRCTLCSGTGSASAAFQMPSARLQGDSWDISTILQVILGCGSLYHMHLNFHRTKLSWIADLLNIHGFYFCGCWEQIGMGDHLVPRNLCNYVTALLGITPHIICTSIQYKGDNGALLASFGVHFYDFATLAWNIRGIELFMDGLPNHENSKSFVLRKFKHICYVLQTSANRYLKERHSQPVSCCYVLVDYCSIHHKPYGTIFKNSSCLVMFGCYSCYFNCYVCICISYCTDRTVPMCCACNHRNFNALQLYC